ncbi:MAG TPA: YhjD/YihY/BrkB family envelope integrity protein, partial [Acidimicrobiales bacterium]|nr:YhjD/YihY/BrkB family envelope integrity protein [Acidimicrobiales bacterium]
MNPIEAAVRGVDNWQQRHRATAFAFAVFKKFGDDRGSMLVVTLAYYGFMALFPMLLVVTTILGFVGNQRLDQSVIGSTLKQFPVYGEQIGHNVPHPLHGSVPGLVLGLLGLIYGALGVAQAAQHAMAQIWNVPGVVRPGFVPRMARALLLFVTMGLALGAGAGLSAVATAAGRGLAFRVLTVVVELAFNVAVTVVAFRVLTPRQIGWRDLLVGAAVAGVAYTVLLTVGTALIQHQLRHAQAVYGQYGFVLGLIGFLGLVATLTLYAAELNVVRRRRLWPRSIVQPPLTPADRKVLADIARQEER